MTIYFHIEFRSFLYCWYGIILS